MAINVPIELLPGTINGMSSSSSTGQNQIVSSNDNIGIYGRSDTWVGVKGENTYSGPPKTGFGFGVFGISASNEGVHGESTSPQHAGVAGINTGGNVGVYGFSNQGEGVHGDSASPQHAAVAGINTGGNVGVYGFSNQGPDGCGVFGENASTTEGGHGARQEF
jgi:hypothetical protein